MYTFDDIAIPISWPDKTARGDEKWMAFLKRIRIVKNLNFRVGHAAILLIERSSGRIHYFDFGRYIVPRGYGRSRSAQFDPRLLLHTVARFDDAQKLANLSEIVEELAKKEDATHGGGRTMLSICENICFAKGLDFAQRLVQTGPILYGAFAKNNNSCSRFVAQILVAAMTTDDARRRKLLYPESFKASPTSNVVNAIADPGIYCFADGNLVALQMCRKASMRFQFDLLCDNFTKKGAKKLGDDSVAGMVQYTERPHNVPSQAQWLGGIGEGAWFVLEQEAEQLFTIKKYNVQGNMEYAITTQCLQRFNIAQAYAFTYYFTHEYHNIVQDGQVFLFRAITSQEKSNKQYHSIQAIS